MNDSRRIILTECPRDSFQGFSRFIPTEEKTAYINMLIRSGMRRIDFGSFVSPKAVPQMADTAAVFENLKRVDDLYLIGIVANLRGVEGIAACNHKWGHTGGRINAAGYPLSVNETFQRRNTNRGHNEAWSDLDEIAALCRGEAIDLIVYLSMAFGNPFGEPHDPVVVVEFAKRLEGLGAALVMLADTVGVGAPGEIRDGFGTAKEALPGVELGVHLHAAPSTLKEKVEAALDAGCRRFDSAVGGIGGCPFADDALVGNIDTIQLLPLLKENRFNPEIDAESLLDAAVRAAELTRLYA